MANYYATARSNYFRVKDCVTFENWCRTRNLDFWQKDYEGKAVHYAMSPADFCEGGWPTYQDNDTELDIPAELSGHLLPTEVAVLFQIGHEKLRYLTGEAIAVNAEGETVRVDLDDIYEKALSKLGAATVTGATY